MTNGGVTVRAGQIVVVDMRGALPKEPNKIRPCVVVEDSDLFDSSYPNVIIVPIADEADFLIQRLAVELSPTDENGCTKLSYAIAHSVATVSKQRIKKITPSCVTDEQLASIRTLIAKSIGLV
jgi:mRNA interferase MazF